MTSKIQEGTHTLPKTSNTPKRIHVNKLIRNGMMREGSFEVTFVSKIRRGLSLYSIADTCHCCNGTLGYVESISGEDHFVCYGISCLRKLAEKC